MKIIIQAALTGAAAMSWLLQFLAGRDTKTGRSLNLAAAAFLLAGTMVNLLWLLLDREERYGSDDEAEL